MNEVLFTGFNELSLEHQMLVVEHVMDRGNWAKLTRRKPESVEDYSMNSSSGATSTSTSSASTLYIEDEPVSKVRGRKKLKVENSLTLYKSSIPSSYENALASVPTKPSSEITIHKPPSFSLVRNENTSNALSGKTVVMTGLFPELGGGVGLKLGKDRLKSLLQSMGAKVTSSVSGKTDFLVVGQEPGVSKVAKARQSTRCKLVGLADLKNGIEGGKPLDALPEPEIKSYSAGYYGNGLAYRIGGGSFGGYL
jgi:NAD-dependent DNA ligase